MKKNKTYRRLVVRCRRHIPLVIFGTLAVLSTSAVAMQLQTDSHAAKPVVAANISHYGSHNTGSTLKQKHPTPSPVPKPAAAPPSTPSAAAETKPAAPPPPKPATNVADSPAAVASTNATPGDGVSGLSAAAPSPTPSPAPTPTPSPTSSDSPASMPSPSPAPAPCIGNASRYTSSNWAGYFKSGCTFTAVSGNWIVPLSTSTSTTDTTVDATWIGIGGVTSNDLIQVGTEDTVDTDGTINAAVFYELLPDFPVYPTSITVSPGDHISVSVVESTQSNWLISINNTTSGKSFTKKVSYTSSYSSAEWIEEDPSYADGSLAPFDNFGTITFTSASATGNGTAGTLADANSITIVDNQNRALAVPSAVSGSNSGTFSVSRSIP